MKLNIFISLLLVVLCVFCVFTVTKSPPQEESRYDEYVQKGDEFVKEGLYQRAIKQYMLAASEDANEALYEKIREVYLKRYEEAPDETFDDYMNFIKDAARRFPTNMTYVNELVSYYEKEGDSSNVYKCLKRAIENGCKDEEVLNKMLSIQYAFYLRDGDFSDIKRSASGVYTLRSDSGLRLYSADGGTLLSSKYSYLGLYGDGGVVAYADKDSRLVDLDGLVMGIFPGEVSYAGSFSGGLIPACIDGKYAYYNEYAKKKLGDFDFASNFEGGMAAVKADGKWRIIDKSGSTVLDKYDEIIVDDCGRYRVNGIILVKCSDGKYALLNSEFEKIADFNCENVDIYTGNGLTAVSVNGKWGFADETGNIIIKPDYECARSFSNGIAAVCKDGKWGFIDRENHLVIDYQFADAGYMDDKGMCAVKIIGEGDSDAEVWRFLKLKLGITAK